MDDEKKREDSNETLYENEILHEEILNDDNINESAVEEKSEEELDNENSKRATKILIAVMAVIICVSLGNVFYLQPYLKYKDAQSLMEQGEYDKAMTAFEKLKDYRDSDELYNECYYQKAVSYVNNGRYGLGMSMLSRLGEYKESRNVIENYAKYTYKLIAAGDRHTVAVNSIGQVMAAGDNSYGQCEVDYWKGILSVNAGAYHTVGLKEDGTVLAAGDNSRGQCDVSEWRDIIAIETGAYYTKGLKADGSMVIAGEKDDSVYNTEVLSIDNISRKTVLAEADGKGHMVRLMIDGTMTAEGDNSYGQCDVSQWGDILLNEKQINNSLAN